MPPFLLVATRTEVILFAVQSNELVLITTLPTEFDSSAIALWTQQQQDGACTGLIVAVAQWVTNTLTLYQVTDGGHQWEGEGTTTVLFDQTYSSCIYDLAMVSLSSSSPSSSTSEEMMEEGKDKENLFLMISHIDGSVRILSSSSSSSATTTIGHSWKEEKYFHVCAYPGRWVLSSNPSSVLLAGHRPCMLYQKNTSWLYVTQ